MKFSKVIKNICLVFMVCTLSVQCQTSLIKKYKKNEMVMEKINIGELDEYASRQKKAKKNQKISYRNTRRKDDSLKDVHFTITETVKGKYNELSVNKKEGKYISIRKTIYHSDYCEFITFNKDGNLKSKVLVSEKKMIKDDKFGEIALLNLPIDTSIYFDAKGNKIAEYDYGNLYKFKLNDLISYLKENYSANGDISINKLLFSEFTKAGVDKVLNEYAKLNIPLKKEHPYWIISYTTKNSEGITSKTVYIDGITGDKLGEQVLGPIKPVD